MLFRTLMFLALLGSPSIGISSDWGSCADDLDRLRRASSDANDAATQAESDEDEYENCKNYPDTYDLYGDRCRSVADEYRDSLDALENALDTVNDRVRSVALSCGMPLPAVAGPRIERSGDRLCNLYRSYKGRMSDQLLMQQCTVSKPESECTKCIYGN